MWPLLGLSVLALAIICDRAMFYSALDFPSAQQTTALNTALATRDVAVLAAALPPEHPVFGPFFSELRKLAETCAVAENESRQEVLGVMAQEITSRLDSRLPLLNVIVRVSPLVGLLGTILGMINTFSRLATAQGGVDLIVLADGIWQALITTAAGLIIAIPVLLIHYLFTTRKRRVLDALERISGAVFLLADIPKESGNEN